LKRIRGRSDVVLKVNDCLWEFDVDEKTTWASGRRAPKTEEIAYSLMGIFVKHLRVVPGSTGLQTDDAFMLVMLPRKYPWKENIFY
jgi:hypothetical protein